MDLHFRRLLGDVETKFMANHLCEITWVIR